MSSRIILVEPGKHPAVREVDWDQDSYREIRETLGGAGTWMRYPSQLDGKGLGLIVVEDGLPRQLPYNRWGIVGKFAICRPTSDGLATLTDDDVEKVIADLCQSKGYLDCSDSEGEQLRRAFAGWREHREPPSGWRPGDKPKAKAK